METHHTLISNEIQVDCSFPGGNIVVDDIIDNNLFVHQDLRDTTPKFILAWTWQKVMDGTEPDPLTTPARWFGWFYWYFRVTGAAGKKLNIHFTRGDVLTANGPACSFDGGKTWQWLGAESLVRGGFVCQVPENLTEVRFCTAFPYLEEHLHAFLKKHVGSPNFRMETLCQSRKGRPVEKVLLGQLGSDCKYKVALTARGHASEMMASHVLQGIMDTVMSDTDLGQWLSNNVAFFVVPFVDKDGVEDGDEGKNRIPFDHNRDYAHDSIYPEVKAIRQQVAEWAEGKLRIAIDLHDPELIGDLNEQIFFVGSPVPEIQHEISRFSKFLGNLRQGPLPYQTKNNLEFGKGWNTKRALATFTNWATELPGIAFGASLEIAYSNFSGVQVTDESARLFGRDIANAIRSYLQWKESSND